MKILYLLIILLFLAVSFGVFRNTYPRKVGIIGGKLHPCPATPNCVCSEYGGGSQTIEPFPLPADESRSPISILAALVASMPRTTVVEQSDEYLHAVFRSKIFSFNDDVEFRLDRKERVVHVRSASRVGYSDLGVNRNRIESLRLDYLKSI